MDPRYEQSIITAIFNRKFGLWQETELAVIQARVELEMIPKLIYSEINGHLKFNPINRERIAEIEKILNHDLNAFVDERKGVLPRKLAKYFHDGLTSYDTEEPAFARMLFMAGEEVGKAVIKLKDLLAQKAVAYRHTIMMARTHGQEAKLQTHGKRCLTWLQELRIGYNQLSLAAANLRYSKLSGAIGNYGDLDPILEKKALAILGLQPFYGATQIMPRVIYLPLALALVQIVGTISNIAETIRLGARSGNPIYQEPFGKLQKGSSAMPHKKNTIRTEQLIGMSAMANGYLQMIVDTIRTWEERDIRQSCVERVAWPDLFHVTLHSLNVITKVLSGMKVYPDRMYQEIINSKGCYASDEAKNFLGKKLSRLGLSSEDAYRIVQLAADNVHSPSGEIQIIRDTVPKSHKQAEKLMQCFSEGRRERNISICDVIKAGSLYKSPNLDADHIKVDQWNRALKKLFEKSGTQKSWQKLFSPAYLLRHEKNLFEEIL